MNPRSSSIGPEVRDLTTLAVRRISALEYVSTMTGVRLINDAGADAVVVTDYLASLLACGASRSTASRPRPTN